MSPLDPALARVLWHRIETINAVTYFSPECREEPERLGIKGFWMAYFGCRAAPMGAVAAPVVEATFFNFHPDRVRRAIPQVWAIATPAVLLDLRAAAAASALRRLLSDRAAEQLADEVLLTLRAVIEQAVGAGRPLFTANRDVAPPADPVAAMWLAATTLREHRGDGHVALLTGAGLDGCEVHVLVTASEGVDAGIYQRSRGWSEDDWGRSVDRLTARGLVDRAGVTAAGRDLRDQIERRTDELAIEPYLHLGQERVDVLLALLAPAAEWIAASGEITFPNPMGLPGPGPGWIR